MNKRHRLSFYLSICLLLMLFGIGQVYAQSFQSAVVGQVTDAAGAVIPGAKVTIIGEETGRTSIVMSGTDGGFTIPQLPPGQYELRIEATGFRRTTRRGLALEIGKTLRTNITLEAGEVNDTVTVTSDVPPINTDTSNKGEVIVQKQVQDLPLNGRNFTDLALLVPGIYKRPDDDDQGEGLAAAGTRTEAANFTLDGIANRSDRNGGVGVNTSIESIREFNVSTSTYSAEYGRTAGAQINVVSKSGTNQFHGSIFDYLRNDLFDARNVLTPPDQDKTLKRNQFGGSIGGPLTLPPSIFGPIKYDGSDRTFFFFSYEGTRERRSEISLNTAPNAAWLGGDFRNVRGPGANGRIGDADDTNRILFIDPVTRTKREFPTPNVIPDSLFHPVSKQMLSFIPASNNSASLDSYVASGLTRVNRNQYLLRFDQRITQRNNLSLRWARQKNERFDPFPSERNFYPGFGRDAFSRYDSVAMSDTQTFSPATINEVRLGFYEQRNQNLGQNRFDDFNAKFGIPGVSPGPDLQGWPAIRIDGFSEFGDRPNDPFIYTMKNLQLFDVLTLVRGRHNLRIGADIIRSTYIEADVRNVRGDFRFRGRNAHPSNSAAAGFYSFADFLLGLPDSTQRQIGAPPDDLNGWQYGFFIQDDWRVRPWLTLNLGLRYELQLPMKESRNMLANFIPELGEVVTAGTPGYPEALLETDKNNIGPRIGFALRPFGNDRTVIRGGGGIYYSLETFNVARQQLAVTFPFLVREQYSRQTNDPLLLSFSNPFPERIRSVQGVNTPVGAQLENPSPVFYQYNLTIEREIIRDLALEVGYVGSLGRHLGIRYNINAPYPTGQLNNNNAPVTARRYSDFADITFQEQSINSSYNALQLALRRRVKQGLTLLASYTFSRALDYGSSTNNSTTGAQRNPQDIRNFAAEKGPADFDRQHQFSASFNYELPFGRGRALGSAVGGLGDALISGWQLNGVLTLLSGRPFTPQYNAPDVSQQRPDLIGDPESNIPPGLFFNPNAFARPLATREDPTLFGNAGRNILIGPDFRNFDLSVLKNFRLTERLRLQFRVESFNAFNHPNFQIPVNLLDRSDAAQLTRTANEAREWQVALKLIF
jgi:Carboxypeptidase regulatory-like domain